MEWNPKKTEWNGMESEKTEWNGMKCRKKNGM